MEIPITLKRHVIGAFGDEGRIWLRTLGHRLEFFLEKWKLAIVKEVPNLSYNYVVKVTDQNGLPFILKMGVPNSEFTNEVNTIKRYGGKGFVQLVKADTENGVMLQEQLIPGTMLSELDDEDKVILHFIEVYRTLRRPKPYCDNIPTVMDWAEVLTRYLKLYTAENSPILPKTIEIAINFFQEIEATSIEQELLHGDLHHQNILFSNEKGWIGIDPKGVVGDRYFDLVPFLVNQLHNKKDARGVLKHRVHALSEQMGLDVHRLLKASFAISILRSCWAIEDSEEEWKHIYTIAGWFYSFLQS